MIKKRFGDFLKISLKVLHIGEMIIGIQMDIDGNIFNGTFLKNKKTGCGSYKKSDGTIEQGHWRENVRQGLFKITYSNGAEFCVNYVNGKEDGIPRNGDCIEVECL